MDFDTEVIQTGDATSRISFELNGQGPELILVTGLPATGKTRISRELSEQLMAPFVNQQYFLDAVAGSALDKEIQTRASDWLTDILGYYLHTGKTVVLETQALTRQGRSPFVKAVRAFGYPVYCIWVQSSREFQDLLRRTRGYSTSEILAADAVWQPPEIKEGFQMISTYPNLMESKS
jgi:predicted kinase